METILRAVLRFVYRFVIDCPNGGRFSIDGANYAKPFRNVDHHQALAPPDLSLATRSI
jgi:hypothetical protein